MATSSVSWNEVLVADLAVSDTFKQLMKDASDKDSLYIKAKESLLAYFASDDCTLSERERVTALSELVSNMSIQMTGAAMNAAVNIAKENRDGSYQLTKLKEDTLLTKEQRNKVATDIELVSANTDSVAADANNKVIQGWKIQSDMVRENGVNSFPSLETTVLPVANVADKGLKWEQEQQTKMSVYATIAKSYRESGVVSWTVDGASNKINAITDLAPATPGLTKAQETVAIRQKKGFDDNMRQHAANSSANMIGLLLSAEESGAITPADVAQWRTAVGYLNSGGSTTVVPNGVLNATLTDGFTMSKASGITINGTSSYFTAGTVVTVKFTTGSGATLVSSNLSSGIIQQDDSWTVVVASTDISNLAVTAAGSISMYAVDTNGLVIFDNTVTTVNITA